MYTKLTIFTLAYLAPTALGYAVNGGYTPASGLLAKRLTCSGDEKYCGNICISSSDECCDHSYYCSSDYSCGHGGKCCQGNDCSTTGTYVYCKYSSTNGREREQQTRVDALKQAIGG